MSDKDISKMDFKELRSEVQELRDELARAKRYFGDLLEHLDYDNFSSRVVKDKKGMETSIKQTAEAITLQAKDIKDLSTSMSELKITAREISATVSENYEDLDGKITSNTAKISVTADGILQTVSKTYQTLDAAAQSEWEFRSQISQTSDSISSIVSKNISAYFNSEIEPNKMSNVTDAQKAMLCLCGGKYYYFNDTKNEWVEYPAEGLQTMFKQTEEFFEFTSLVKINGDMFVDGSISASAVDTDNLSCVKMYSKGMKDGYYAKIASNVGDFGLYKPTDDDNLNPMNEKCVWGVYNSDVTTETVNFYAYGNNYMGYSGAEEHIYPKGNWNFDSCTITGWGNNAPVAVFG